MELYTFDGIEEFMEQIAERRKIVHGVPVSQIGERLGLIIKTRYKAVPCGSCRFAIARLNRMTVEQVQADRENIIADIASRAASKAPHWWQSLLVKADQALGTGKVDAMIGGWLDEAIAAEVSGQPLPASPAAKD